MDKTFSLKKLAKSPQLLGLLLFLLPISPNHLPAQAHHTDAPLMAQAETANPLQTKAEQFIDVLVAKQYTNVHQLLHPDLQTEFPPKRIREEWEAILDQSGAFQERGGSRVIESVTGQFVSIEMQFKNGTDECLIIFNEDEQIIGVDFPESLAINEIANTIVDALIVEDFATVRKYLHPFLKTDISSTQIKKGWVQLQQENGEAKKRLKTRLRRGSTIDNTDIVMVNIAFANLTEELLIIFDRDKKVTGIDFPIQ